MWTAVEQIDLKTAITMDGGLRTVVIQKTLDLSVMQALQVLYTINEMKSTKVQTLGAVALPTRTACTDEASIVGLSPLSWAIVLDSNVLPCLESVYIRVCIL